jgi:hypothetical protein
MAIASLAREFVSRFDYLTACYSKNSTKFEMKIDVRYEANLVVSVLCHDRVDIKGSEDLFCLPAN